MAEPKKLQAWLAKRLVKLTRKPFAHFPSKGKSLNAPKRPGVYVIYSPRGRVIHVGATPRAAEGLHQRLRDHLQGKHLLRDCLGGPGSKLRLGYKFRYIVVKNPRQRALLEALAIGCLCPVNIGGGSGVKLMRR